MNFMEGLESDIEKLFSTGTGEFCKEHRYNGKTTCMIVSSADEKEETSADDYIDGLKKEEKLIYVRKEELAVKPFYNQNVELDGERYVVVSVDIIGNVYLIQLRRG